MRFLVISLCNTDTADHDGQIVYTSLIGGFEYENPALEYIKGKDRLLLIDCENRKPVNTASVEIMP